MPYNSLEELTRYYGSTKPKNDGSQTGAKAESDYWGNYGKDLASYYASASSNPDFDYSSYKIMRDYVSSQSKSAGDFYSNLQLLAKNAANSKAQQAVIKDQSLKYAGNSLAAAGLDSQGIGQTVQAGIGNNYSQQLGAIDTAKQEESQSAYKTYQQAASDAASANQDSMELQQETANSSSYDLATQLLNSGVDLDTVLTKYGEGLTETQKSTLKDLSDASNGNSAADKYISYSADKTSYKSYDDLKNITLDNGKKASDFIDHEIKYLMGGYGSTGDGFQDKLVNGFVVRLGNGSGGNDYGSHLYLVYKDGAWYKTTEKAFIQASNKQTIQGK